jgi:hypothetical protein
MARIGDKDCRIEASSVSAKLMDDQRSAPAHVRASGAARMTPGLELGSVQIRRAVAAQMLGNCAKHPGLRVKFTAEGPLMINVTMH